MWYTNAKKALRDAEKTRFVDGKTKYDKVVPAPTTPPPPVKDGQAKHHNVRYGATVETEAEEPQK
jgi:hypothetical protein